MLSTELYRAPEIRGLFTPGVMGVPNILSAGAMSDRESDPEEEAVLDEPLVYHDVHHKGATMQRLNTLRKGGHFCDVKIKVESKNVDAHKAVLGCSSTFLFELFSTCSEEGSGQQQQHFTLDNIEYDSFNCLVEYAYTSRLEVPAHMVREVYKTAVMLKMHAAAQACSRHLAEHLTLDNCLGIRAFANSNSDQDLALETDAFIQENMDNVVLSAHSKTLATIQVDIMGVEEDELTRESVDQLCNLAVDWAQHSLHEQGNMDELTANLHKLFLAGDNTLHDCHEAVDSVSSSDEINDYKRIAKKRQRIKKRHKQPPVCPPSPEPRSMNTHSGTHSGQIEHQYKQPEFHHEFKVIATQLVEKRFCLVMAMLENTMVKLSLHFISGLSNGHDAEPTEHNALTNGTDVSPTNGVFRSPEDSPDDSPRTSICGDKACSLTPLARMSVARCAVGAAVLDNKLLALGGYDRGECLSTVEQYDLISNTWKPLQNMRSPRGRFDVSQLDGRIYTCGGSNGSHELRSAEYYDSKDQSWGSLPDMQHWRSSSGVTLMDGCIYVLGGWSGQSGLANCEVFNIAENTWKPIKHMNTGRSQAGVCHLKDRVIAVGGCNSWTSINTVETYDPQTNSWTYLPPMSSARRGAGVAIFQDKLYVVGGSDGTQSLATIEIYDPKTNTWTSGPSMSVPRANVGVAVVHGRLFAAGGFSGKAFLDTIEYLPTGFDSEWCSYLPLDI